MKLRNLLGWSSALCLSAMIAQAQETNDVEKINKQLKQLQDSFEKQQREMKESFDRMLREQQQQIEALKKQLEVSRTNAPAVISAPPAVVPSRPPEAAPSEATPLPAQAIAGQPWSP